MDPDAVKSTLSNLAFGNVIAAAARDYQKVNPLLPNDGQVSGAIPPLCVLKLAQKMSSGVGALDLLEQAYADALVNGHPALALDCYWKLNSVAKHD